VADDDRRWKAVARYEENVKRQDATALELGREAYIAGNLIVQGWRERRAGIAQALAQPHQCRNGGGAGTWNGCPCPRHPSRRLSGQARLFVAPAAIRSVPSHTAHRKSAMSKCRWAGQDAGTFQRERQPGGHGASVSVRTTHGCGIRSILSITYNNLVQGTARDLLVHAMHNVERAGYPVVLHAHDGLVAEVHKDFGSVEEIERLMCDMPPWAAGLPMAAAGFRLKRYAKGIKRRVFRPAFFYL
jgi:DNA polymerase